MEYDVSFQTVSWFNNRKNDETLEISPKFQRRAVWLEKERASLLSTIISGLPFPEVYIQVVTDLDTGKQKHVVVDGQQRITSILQFIDNEFCLPINEPWDGQYFKDLSDDQKERFWDYQVVVRFLRKTNDEEIRNLFTKLNTNNVALNDQELRNARFTGKFKQLSERLADNPYFQSIGLFTARDVRRMLDIEYVSELLVRLIYGVTNKKDLLETTYISFEEDFPDESKFEDEFNVALNLVRSLLDDNNSVLFKSKGNFYSLFGVCADHYRLTGKTQFENLSSVKRLVSELVARSRADDFDPENPDIETYADVSTRSTSDKSRRAERERILMTLIKKGEVVAPSIT